VKIDHVLSLGLDKEILDLRSLQRQQLEEFSEELWAMVLSLAFSLVDKYEDGTRLIVEALGAYGKRIAGINQDDDDDDEGNADGERAEQDLSALHYKYAVVECCMIHAFAFPIAIRIVPLRSSELVAASDSALWLLDPSMPSEGSKKGNDTDSVHAISFCECFQEHILSCVTDRVWRLLAPKHGLWVFEYVATATSLWIFESPAPHLQIPEQIRNDATLFAIRFYLFCCGELQELGNDLSMIDPEQLKAESATMEERRSARDHANSKLHPPGLSQVQKSILYGTATGLVVGLAGAALLYGAKKDGTD
jgi:hypothetical protein